MDLGRYLCEVRAGQYWRLDNLRSFDEFLEKKFPESRRKAYYLMAIHEHLPRIPKADLRSMGWTKARELAKVARRERQGFDCAPWVHKAQRTAPRRVQAGSGATPDGEGNRTVGDSLFQGVQEPIACHRAGTRNSGPDAGERQSRGYCLEMICADFLAGVSLETGNQDALLSALTRLVLGLPLPQREQLFESVQVVP